MKPHDVVAAGELVKALEEVKNMQKDIENLDLEQTDSVIQIDLGNYDTDGDGTSDCSFQITPKAGLRILPKIEQDIISELGELGVDINE